MEKDFIALRSEELERYVKVYRNVARFIEEASKHRDAVVKKLERIRALPAKRGAIVVDPTKRFLAALQIDTLAVGGEDSGFVAVVMKPPIIPHFFLASSYLSLRLGLIPVALIRVSPILSLIAVLGDVDDAVVPATNFIFSTALVSAFAVHEVAVLPFPSGAIRLPTRSKDGILYLCNMGFSTVPLEGSYNIEVDLGGVPPIEDDVLRSQEFKSLREILDSEVVARE